MPLPFLWLFKHDCCNNHDLSLANESPRKLGQ